MNDRGGNSGRGNRGAETFRELFQQAPIAIGLSRGGVAIDANAALLRLFGYSTVEEVRGKNIFDHFPEEVREVLARRAASRVTGSAEPTSYETLGLRRDGTLFPIQVSVSRVDLEDGPALAAFMVDLTSLREAELAVAGNERRFRALIENGYDAVALVDASGRLLYVSPAVTRIQGYTPDELVGTTGFDFVHPDDAADTRGILERLVSEPGSTVRFEFRLRHRDGSYRWIEGVGTNLLEEPAVGAIVANYRDITERRAAEKRLGVQALALAQVFDAVVTTDLAGKITSWNPSAERIYGWRSHEMIGREVLSALPTRFAAPVTQQFVIEMLLTTGLWRGEVGHVTQGGRSLRVEAAVSLLRDEQGAPAGGIAVLRDVTPQRELEEELRRSHRLEAVGVLAGGVAQGFDSVLRSILRFADVAGDALDASHPAREELERVRRAAGQATETTQRLLALSRPPVLQAERFDLRDRVRDFALDFVPKAGPGISVVVDASEDPLPISADPGLVAQVLSDLLEHARASMPAGGELRVETRRRTLDDDFVVAHPWARPGAFGELTVADTGRGMDEAARARVFEPVFSADGSSVGLGLAVVYGVVRQHEGFVSVQSEPGRGTTFRIYLPLADPSAREPLSDRRLRGGKETILVAEDEPLVRRLLETTLARLGYDVLSVEDGEEAIRTFAGHPGAIDLVVLDVVMPRLGGPEAYRRMKEMRSSLKAILTTGYAPESARLAALARAEGLSVVAKPFSPAVFARKVREVLDAP